MAQPSPFREYLVKSGGEEAIWNVLIKLDKLEAKPEDPVEYVRQNMDRKLSENFADLKQEIEEAKGEIDNFAQEHPKLYAKYLKKKKNPVTKKGKKKKK